MEHAFHALKDLVGLRRTRYKGMSKVTNQLCARVRLRSELVGVPGRRLRPRRGAGAPPGRARNGRDTTKSPGGPSRAGFWRLRGRGCGRGLLVHCFLRQSKS